MAREETPAEKRLKKINDPYLTEKEKKALIENNLDSAIRIASMPENDFVLFCEKNTFFNENSVSGTDKIKVNDFYQNAKSRAAQVGLAFLGEKQKNSPYLKNRAFRTKDEPEKKGIFQELDYFCTEKANTIYGSAAYYFDLLRIVNNKIKPPSESNASLSNRRQDLFETPLDHKHTEKRVPQLEIVNYVLARHLYQPATTFSDPPEFDEKNKHYLDEALKQIATNKDTRWFLPPVNLPLEEVRSYLKQFNTSLFDIYSAFFSEDKEDCIFLNNNKNIALEYLDLSHSELNWLNGLISSADDKTFVEKIEFNLPSSSVDFNLFLNITKLDRQKMLEIIPYEGYFNQSEKQFYENLYINKKITEASSASSSSSAGSSTDTNNNIITVSLDIDKRVQNLNNLSTEKIKKIAFFTFLAKKLAVSYLDCEAIINACDIKDKPADEQLLKVAKIIWLNRKASIPVKDICVFFKDMPKEIFNSVYNRKEHPSFKKSFPEIEYDKIDEVDETSKLDWSSAQLINRSSLSLGFSASSLNILLTSLNKINPKPKNSEIFNFLYRVKILSKICGISFLDLINLCLVVQEFNSSSNNVDKVVEKLFEKLNKKDDGSIKFVLSCYSTSRWIKNNSLNLGQLVQIFGDEPNYQITKNTEQTTLFFNSLWETLTKRQEIPKNKYRRVLRVKDKPSKILFDTIILNKSGNNLNAYWWYNGKINNASITVDSVNEKLLPELDKFSYDANLINILVEKFHCDHNYGNNEDNEASYQLILQKLSVHTSIPEILLAKIKEIQNLNLCKINEKDNIEEKFKELQGKIKNLPLELEKLKDLLLKSDKKIELMNDYNSILEYIKYLNLINFLFNKNYDNSIEFLEDISDKQGNFIFINKLLKIRTLIDMLDLSHIDAKSLNFQDELSLFLELGVEKIKIDNMQNFIKMRNLQKEFKNHENDFIQYFMQIKRKDDSSLENFVNFLTLVNWDKNDFDAICKLCELNLDGGTRTGDVLAVLFKVNDISKLNHLFKLLKKLGDNKQIFEEINNLLKIHNSSDLTIEENLADMLGKILSQQKPEAYDKARRNFAERTRDVLVDHVLRLFAEKKVHPEIQKASDLSEYLFLDVQISGALSSTYVVQGTATVQSYLQRCRLGVEKGVNVNISENEWKWIENYRMWEANRKILLYPENYIEPDLRSEQSPEFKQLTQDLLQNNLDNESVSTAFRSYLQKIEKVSNLIYCDAYSTSKPQDKSEKYKIYLFAHTREFPHNYYYRTLEYTKEQEKDLTGIIWGYWNKIDLKIPTGLISGVYAFDRLFIFWVEPKLKQVPTFDDKNKLNGYETTFSFKITYSYQHSDKSWEQPQTLPEVSQMPFLKIIEQYEKIGGLEDKSSLNNLIKLCDDEKDKYGQPLKGNKIIPIYQNGILKLSVNTQNFNFSTGFNHFNYLLNKVSVYFDNDKIVTTYFNQKFALDKSLSRTNLPTLPSEEIYYQTIRTVSLDNNVYLLIRQSEGILLYFYNRYSNMWNFLSRGPAWSDRNFWNNPVYFKTIRLVALNNCLYLLARNSSGIELHKFDIQTNKWGELSHPSKSDALKWSDDVNEKAWTKAEYYETIQLVPCGDNLYLFTRNAQIKIGLLLYKLEKNGDTCKWEEIKLNSDSNKPYPAWENSYGWGEKKYYKTIQLVSFSNVLYLLAKDNHGIVLFQADTANTKWKQVYSANDDNGLTALKWSDDVNEKAWTKAEYYETIQLVPCGNNLYLFSRKPAEKKGVLLYKLEKNGDTCKWEDRSPGKIADSKENSEGGPDWGNALGWDKEMYYKTIRLLALGTTLYLLGRGKFGISLFKYDTIANNNNGKWELLSFAGSNEPNENDHTHVPKWSDDVNEKAWTKAEYYETIRLVAFNKMLFLSGKDECYVYNINENKWGYSIYDRSHNYQFDFSPSAQKLVYDDKNEVISLFPANKASEDVCATVCDRADIIPINNGLPGQVILNNVSQSYFIYSGPITTTTTSGIATTTTTTNTLHLEKLSNSDFINFLYRRLLLGDPANLFAILGNDNDLKDNTSDFSIVKDKFSDDTVTDKLNFEGGFGAYLWEIFFHLPFLVAKRLTSQNRFEEARNWYHYIFNPLIIGLEHTFRFPPFKDIDKIDYFKTLKNEDVLNIYHNNSFDSHGIAKIRPIAYKKAIVMHYIQNLIDWGDHLFSLNTRESINQATNLYMMANDLLGKKPQSLGFKKAKNKLLDYNNHPIAIDQATELALIKVEDTLDVNSNLKPIKDINEMNFIFAIPENQDFIAYWDKIEDRLFKIRHSLNISGSKQELALFSPEIDPRQLVRAAASGAVDVQDFLPASQPHYRFHILLDQTKGFVQQVIQLGNSLLAALERKDNEQLQLKTLGQQSQLLQLISTLKQKQVDEATCMLEQVKANLVASQNRVEYFKRLIDTGLITEETQAKNLKIASLVGYGVSTALELAAGIAAEVPQFLAGGAGAFGSPLFMVSEGGINISSGLHLASSVSRGVADTLNFAAEDLMQEATYKRREEEWNLQLMEAESNLEQINHQIKCNELQVEIAKEEYKQYEMQIKHQNELHEYYQTKFTNIELYRWMVDQLQSFYKQTYDLAIKSAKKAEKAYQFETTSQKNFIGNNYYSFFRKGLLAGEGLMLDLNRLEQSYLEENKRLLEIEKTISLKTDLKDNEGNPINVEFNDLIDINKKHIKFTITEKMLDFSYKARIKKISVTIPSVAKPYKNTAFVLTNNTTGKSIVLSNSVNDFGVFAESRQDGRYLPFEGLDLVDSSWTIENKGKEDVTVSNILIHFQYTVTEITPTNNLTS